MLLLLQLEQGVSRPKELSFGAKMQYHALACGTQWEYTILLIFFLLYSQSYFILYTHTAKSIALNVSENLIFLSVALII